MCIVYLTAVLRLVHHTTQDVGSRDVLRTFYSVLLRNVLPESARFTIHSDLRRVRWSLFHGTERNARNALGSPFNCITHGTMETRGVAPKLRTGNETRANHVPLEI